MGSDQRRSLKMMLTGNYAAAYGAKLSRAEAVPVYPITPQTTVMEKVIELIKQERWRRNIFLSNRSTASWQRLLLRKQLE